MRHIKRGQMKKMNANKPYCVVSVEDDQMIYELIQATLQTLPVNLHHVSNGPQALTIIPQLQPDVIILDINLPGMHGWEVLKELIAQQVSFRGVIVLTAQTSATHRVIAHLQDNVTHFIGKPFDPFELRQAVQQILELD